VITVDYGDVATASTLERIFRSGCMILGVILFTLWSSSVMESTLNDTMSVWKTAEKDMLIKKLQIKYNLTGDAKRFLNLMSEHVETFDIKEEFIFINKLPN